MHPEWVQAPILNPGPYFSQKSDLDHACAVQMTSAGFRRGPIWRRFSSRPRRFAQDKHATTTSIALKALPVRPFPLIVVLCMVAVAFGVVSVLFWQTWALAMTLRKAKQAMVTGGVSFMCRVFPYIIIRIRNMCIICMYTINI